MEKANHYNWGDQANIRKAKYKMVLYMKASCTLKRSYTSKKGDPVYVTYGYYRKPDNGLAMLKSLYSKYIVHVLNVVIYEKTNTGSMEFPQVVFKEKY